jgi:hypothetical protein
LSIGIVDFSSDRQGQLGDIERAGKAAHAGGTGGGFVGVIAGLIIMTTPLRYSVFSLRSRLS